MPNYSYDCSPYYGGFSYDPTETTFAEDVYQYCREEYNSLMDQFAEYTWNEIKIYILNHDIL